MTPRNHEYRHEPVGVAGPMTRWRASHLIEGQRFLADRVHVRLENYQLWLCGVAWDPADGQTQDPTTCESCAEIESSILRTQQALAAIEATPEPVTSVTLDLDTHLRGGTLVEEPAGASGVFQRWNLVPLGSAVDTCQLVQEFVREAQQLGLPIVRRLTYTRHEPLRWPPTWDVLVHFDTYEEMDEG